MISCGKYWFGVIFPKLEVLWPFGPFRPETAASIFEVISRDALCMETSVMGAFSQMNASMQNDV